MTDMGTHRQLSISLAIGVLALAAGCGGSNNDNGGGSTSPATQGATRSYGATAGGSTGATAGVKVTIKNIKFVPERITVKRGQKITWTNEDAFAHTVTARSGATFDSGQVDAGKTFEFTPTKSGTIGYVCTIHPGQVGTIIVQ